MEQYKNSAGQTIALVTFKIIVRGSRWTSLLGILFGMPELTEVLFQVTDMPKLFLNLSLVYTGQSFHSPW